MSTPSPLLRVRDLVVTSAGGRRLIDGVSFDVERGSRTALIGETGSGKSLTTLALVGLLPAGMTVSGSARWHIRDADDETDTAGAYTAGANGVGTDTAGADTALEMIGAPEKAWQRIRGRHAAVIFQEPLTALDPLMRVGRQLAEPIRRHQQLRGHALSTAVRDALAEVRLPDPERMAHAYPHELSGGQRQRVAIAMALACRPTLLIADEATTALDVTVQAEILALIDDLVTRRGLTLLLVTHDIGVVAAASSQVMVLRHGQLLEQGSVTDIIAAPEHPYTASLVSGARRLERALRGGDGAGEVSDDV